MKAKDLAAVIGAFAIAFGLSFLLSYLVIRAYCEAAETIYLLREEAPPDDVPPPADVTALMNEARRIVKEAGDGRLG